MISLANSIHTNVDQSATLVQPKERVDAEEKIALTSSNDAKGHNKEHQSSDHSSGNSSGSSGAQQKDIEFKKSSSEVVNLYSKKPLVKSERGEGGEETRSEETQKSQESKLVSELKKRDTEVRQHELAHAAVGGTHTGAPQYQFVKGPDGKNYAVEGEVSVDASFSGGDAQEKLEKARTIRAAALAPSEPSSQDRKVAAQAARVAMQAQTELVKLKAQEKEQGLVLSDELLGDESVLGDEKTLGSKSQSETSSKETQPILGSDGLKKEAVEKNKAEGFLSPELEGFEKVPQEEKSVEEKSEASDSSEKAEAQLSSSSSSRAEKSHSDSQEPTDKADASGAQETSQSISSSGSSVDEVSVFFEAQSKMLASYEQVVQSGEYINENNGGLFKYAELNVLA